MCRESTQRDFRTMVLDEDCSSCFEERVLISNCARSWKSVVGLYRRANSWCLHRLWRADSRETSLVEELDGSTLVETHARD